MKISKCISASVLATVFLFTAILTCGAVQAADQSIGVLNMRKVFSASDAGKKAQAEMESKVKDLQEKFKKDEDVLIALQEEIEKKSSLWNEEKKQEKAIEFQRMRRDLKAKQEDASLELKQMEEQQLAPIRKELEQVIEKVAKEKGLTMILPSEVVMYAEKSIDISDDIVKALNEKTKK